MIMQFKIQKVMSLNRYPEYIVDIIVSRLLLYTLRITGQFNIGIGAKIRGLPIITMYYKSSINIGNNAFLVSRSRNTALGVNHPIVIRTLRKGARICIGNDFRASGATICAASQLIIGDRVIMGANVTVVDTDFHASDPVIRASQEDSNMARNVPVTIGNDVFLGMNSTVLKGVSIGNGAIVGAGALVTCDVPSGVVVGGNPAVVLGIRSH